MVDSIATSQKRAVSITTVVKGGQRLSGHLENPKLHELLEGRLGFFDCPGAEH